MVTIERANTYDVHEWYQGSPAYSMQGYIAREDGKPIALSGVFWCQGRKYIFSELRERAFAYKKSILKIAKQIVKDHDNEVLYAVSDRDITTSERLLKRLGFEVFDVKNNLYRRG